MSAPERRPADDHAEATRDDSFRGAEEGDASAARAPLPHERLFWRKLAHLGATRGPDWWVRYSPPPFGWAASLLIPRARRAVLRNLRRIRGPASPAEDVRQLLETFGTYASCLAEALSNDAEVGPRAPQANNVGDEHLREVLAKGRGVVLTTAHTAGWECVGPLLARKFRIPLTLVMAKEADARARALQDEARRKAGIDIVHVGDPLGSLPLLRHLQKGGAVALQLDRSIPGMRTRPVRFLDQPGEIPEGPLRLAQLSGAPLVPVFSYRTGYRRYCIEAFAPRHIARRPTEQELDDAAQYLADAMSSFLRRHPTQWFHFA